MMKTIVLAGGSGFLGTVLSQYFANQNKKVVVLSRNPKPNAYATEIVWDGETTGSWCSVLENAKALINLSGKSVDCRYTPKNREQIYRSRINSTRVLGKAVKACVLPPEVWLNTSSATIYRASYTTLMSEYNGQVGDDFSMDVCKQWEHAFNGCPVTTTRKIALRVSIVLGSEGGALPPLQNLTRLGVGGPMGGGEQFFSWIHAADFCKVVDHLIYKKSVGLYNVCAPKPVINTVFMKTLQQTLQIPIALPLTRWMIALGAMLIGTEPELILKSRKVYPQRLLEEEFVFEFPDLKTALADLCRKEKKTS